MRALERNRRAVTWFGAATAIALALLVPAGADAAAPAQISPRSGATLALGSQPVFKVRDATAAARRYKLYVTISTSKRRKRNGDLKRTSIGTFAGMKRRGTTWRYKPPDYSFDEWFMARPGKYYWQAYRIDCSTGNTSCHVHTKIRSFTVE